MSSTGNPIGQPDPRDTYLNASNLDKALNGEAETWRDRLGQERISWGYFEKEFELLINNLHGETGSEQVGFKTPTRLRTVQGKLQEQYSVLDFDLAADGVTDDTVKWEAMVAELNKTNSKAYIPPKCNVVLWAGAKFPAGGVNGGSHMDSLITIKTPPAATEATIGIEYSYVGGYANSYGRIDNVKIQVQDEESPIILVKLNTVSRGAGMRNTTLHVGTGWCVGVEDFYYYQFDNVVFEGKYIADATIGPSNSLRGGAFKQVNNREINNIQFNKCDFRYIETVFQSAGTFVGSNSIGLYNCAIEKIGKGIGDIRGWLVSFNEGYWEKLGMNRNYAADEATVFRFGAGNVTAVNVMMNFGNLPAGNPLFDGVLACFKALNCPGVRPTGFSSTVLKNISYSSPAIIIADNSPVLDSGKSPGYLKIPQQYVGGYTGPRNAILSSLVTSAEYARNFFAHIPLNVAATYAIPERVIAHLVVPDVSKFTVLLKGTIAHTRADTGVHEQLKFSGTLLLDTMVPTNQTPCFILSKVGTEWDTSWDIPVFIRFGSSNSGWTRFELVMGAKTGRSYSRSVTYFNEINMIQQSGVGTGIAIIPAGE